MKTIEQALVEKIESDMKRESENIEVHDIIANILKTKWEGKRLNARIATQVKETLSALYGKEPIVSYDVSGQGGFGQATLSIWSTPHWPDCNQRTVVYLAHNSPPSAPEYKGHWYGEVHAEGFEHMDICHGSAAKERNANRVKLLKDKESIHVLAEAIRNVRTSWATIQKLTDTLDSPAHEIEYHAERLTGLKVDYDNREIAKGLK